MKVVMVISGEEMVEEEWCSTALIDLRKTGKEGGGLQGQGWPVVTS